MREIVRIATALYYTPIALYCTPTINVNLKMYKSGNLKMYNFTH